MSSPSVMFALAEALREDRPERSADWWLTSFGAGFSAHACRVGVA
jgi:alkylresorcinol/alkylpyrone synthase